MLVLALVWEGGWRDFKVCKSLFKLAKRARASPSWASRSWTTVVVLAISDCMEVKFLWKNSATSRLGCTTSCFPFVVSAETPETPVWISQTPQDDPRRRDWTSTTTTFQFASLCRKNKTWFLVISVLQNSCRKRAAKPVMLPPSTWMPRGETWQMLNLMLTKLSSHVVSTNEKLILSPLETLPNSHSAWSK